MKLANAHNVHDKLAKIRPADDVTHLTDKLEEVLDAKEKAHAEWETKISSPLEFLSFEVSYPQGQQLDLDAAGVTSDEKLLYLIRKGREGNIKALFSTGDVNPHVIDEKSGMTGLHLAVSRGMLIATEVLTLKSVERACIHEIFLCGIHCMRACSVRSCAFHEDVSSSWCKP